VPSTFLYKFYTNFLKKPYNEGDNLNKQILLLLEVFSMPLYGFTCENCQEEFEELVSSFSQVDDVICPKCGSGKVARQLSLVAAMKSGGTAGFSMDSSTCAPSG
jgi:putative FmdB family regulatory protein